MHELFLSIEIRGIRLPLLHAQQRRVQTEAWFPIQESKPRSRESHFKAGLAARASSNKDRLGEK